MRILGCHALVPRSHKRYYKWCYMIDIACVWCSVENWDYTIDIQKQYRSRIWYSYRKPRLMKVILSFSWPSQQNSWQCDVPVSKINPGLFDIPIVKCFFFHSHCFTLYGVGVDNKWFRSRAPILTSLIACLNYLNLPVFKDFLLFWIFIWTQTGIFVVEFMWF